MLMSTRTEPRGDKGLGPRGGGRANLCVCRGGETARYEHDQ